MGWRTSWRRAAWRAVMLLWVGVVAWGQSTATQTQAEKLDQAARSMGLILLQDGLQRYERGDFRGAQRSWEQALGIFRRLGLEKEAADALNNLGLLAETLGDYAQARAYYEQALATYRRLGLEKEAADTLNNLGGLAQTLGDYAQARAYYEQALGVFRRLGLNREARRATCNLADVELALGKAESALEAFRMHECGRVRLGRAYLALGWIAQAAEAFRTAAELRIEPEFRISGLIGWGLSEERRGNWKAARQAYQQAVEAIEQQREQLPPGERRHFLSAQLMGFRRLEAYEGLVRVLWRLGRYPEAFRAAEHTRARELLEAISRSRASEGFRIPADLREREQALSDRIAATLKRLGEAGEKQNQQLRSRLEKELAELRQQQQQLIGQLRQQHPEYAAVRYPQPLGPQELALRADEVLLAFEVTEPLTLVFVVRPGRVEKVIEVNKTRQQLQQMVRAFRQVFVEVGRSGDLAALSKFDVRLGRQLYDLLLREALAGVGQDEKVLLVPDEMLALLPWEALVERLPEGELEWEERGHGLFPRGVVYVGDRRVFSYWQSASSLSVLRRLGGPVAGRRLLAVADPVFGPDDPRLGRAAKRPAGQAEQLRMMRELSGAVLKRMGWERFERLRETGQMVERLRGRFGDRLRALTGLEANESRLKQEKLEGYGAAVAFMTHGILDERVPYLQQAALVLSHPELTGEWAKGFTDSDGYLSMSELMGLWMPTELALALACQTGLGGELAGEGVMHLGRAFQYAGARSVLMSLWSVELESTMLLGERVLAELEAGKAKDEALLAARRLLRQKGYEHPLFWAGFILVGERDVLEAKQ